MTTQDSDLLRQFLVDESESFAQKRQDKFWPRNHHRLRPLLTKAAYDRTDTVEIRPDCSSDLP